MGITENKGIYFVNQNFDNKVNKFGTAKDGDRDIEFINFFKNTDTLSDIIDDVSKAINGNYNLIDDPDLTNEVGIASITPVGISYYDYEGNNIIATSPLEDFREKLLAWKVFLLTPPLHGSDI
jgi:hypothetical protein